MSTKYDTHCKKPGCTCDHTYCFQGWTSDTTTSTTPCQYCRPSTFERWFKRENARTQDYPIEALNRIMRGSHATN